MSQNFDEGISGFSGMVATVRGEVSPRLRSIIADELGMVVENLLELAVGRWRRDGWIRYSDDEADCTLQVYRFLMDAQDERHAHVLTIQIESVQPTAKMLLAQASAKTMSRPDLRISVGRVAEVVIECKRLSLRRGHPRRYVSDGIERFISGDYLARGGKGFMIGYVQADEPGAIVEKINAYIGSLDHLGADHRLRQREPSPEMPFRYESRHPRNSEKPVIICHYHLDLR